MNIAFRTDHDVRSWHIALVIGQNAYVCSTPSFEHAIFNPGCSDEHPPRCNVMPVMIYQS